MHLIVDLVVSLYISEYNGRKIVDVIDTKHAYCCIWWLSRVLIPELTQLLV